jgi:tocopherol cyclase
MFFRDPVHFQGNLGNRRGYFEGWYFKHVSKLDGRVFACIPGVSLNKKNPHSFIQINMPGRDHGFSQYYPFPLEDFSASRKGELSIQIADNQFGAKGVSLNLPALTSDLGSSPTIKADLSYSRIKPLPKDFFWPGIMGPYSFVPFMECYHGVASLNHQVDGEVLLDKSSLDYGEGRGYIEKDWGRSFPESWIWLQANSFDNPELSIMFSFAKIPWLGGFFPGFLGFFSLGDHFQVFSSYNSSRLVQLIAEDGLVKFTLEHRDMLLELEAISAAPEKLKAPVLGEMDRVIKESVNAEVTLRVVERGKLLYSGKSAYAGLEIVGEAASLF